MKNLVIKNPLKTTKKEATFTKSTMEKICLITWALKKCYSLGHLGLNYKYYSYKPIKMLGLR